MTLQKTDSSDVSQAHHQTATAIEKHIGPNRELYEYNKSLTQARWREHCDFQVAWIARVASDFQLDILRDEVIWLRDRTLGQAQGRPYVTIKGVLRLLNRHPQFDNYELEPAPDELRRSMRVARDEEQVWVCRLWRKDRSRPTVGYGRATPEDTFVGYGPIENDGAPDKEGLYSPTLPAPTDGSGEPALSPPKGQVYRTPAVVEMARERALRRAAQGAFGWEFMSTLSEPASEGHKRVDPEKGHISPFLGDGTPNTVGCTEAQRRAIHSLAGAQGLPEGRVDPESGEVLEEGWRAELYRLYGVSSTMHLTASQAGEFIDSLSRYLTAQAEPENPEAVDRRELWEQIGELLRDLPREATGQVAAWLWREHDVEVSPEELTAPRIPSRIPTNVLRRLSEGPLGYQVRFAPDP